MKNIKRIFVSLIALFTVFAVAGCESFTHLHAYVYEITVEPTLTTEGEAVGNCNCGQYEEIVLPVLTDTSVWSVEFSLAATHDHEGYAVYSSKYGTVRVESEKVEHIFTNWTIEYDPTEEDEGLMFRECECGEREEKACPALSDDTVWTVVQHKDATHGEAGYTEYESVYGYVSVEIPAIEHTYGEWSWVIEPTYELPGVATRECSCGHTEQVAVAKIGEAPDWTSEVTTEPSYNEAGVRTYTSIYGTYEAVEAKLVAPYDSKTYCAFEVYDHTSETEYSNGVSSVYSWSTASVQLNEVAEGSASAYPFSGTNKVTMVNAETGAIKWQAGEDTYYGYVDFETGIVVVPRGGYSFDDALVFVPYEGASIEGSIWDNVNAFTVTWGEQSRTIMIFNEVAYFGVSFIDYTDGHAISAKDASAEVMFHAYQGETKIAGWANDEDAQKLVLLDGHEGQYTFGEETVELSGFGIIVYNKKGTYEWISENVAGVYIKNVYYEITFDFEAMTCVVVKPMVTITFVTDYDAQEAQTVNKNIDIELPQLTDTLHTFKGWFTEATFENEATGYTPTEDITLYAKWADKVVVNVSGVLEGDASILYLGEGDVIGAALPTYGVEVALGKVFRGWYLSAEFTTGTELSEEATVSAEDSGITIYAKWEALAPYYGTYKGTELYNSGYGNYRSYTLTIDENGKITGQVSGQVTAYDEATGKVSYKKGTSSTVYYFWFEPTTKFIAGIYNNTKISNDYYAFSQYNTTGTYPSGSFYGIYDPSSSTWEAQFVTVKNADNEDVELFIYKNKIYVSPIIKNTLGEVLTISQIKDSKTVVVSTADGTQIIGLASDGTSFATGGSNKTKLLDSYFGTYTFGSYTVVFDGTGACTVNGVDGTYTKVTGKAYDFDIYCGTEAYYTLSLEGPYIGKPLVTISYVVPQGHAAIESQVVNQNVPATLQDGSEEGYVFNGYFFDAEFTQAVPENYAPTSNVTLYAKYSNPAVLTIHYNDGVTQDTVITYSVGDTVTVEKPVNQGYKFVCWFSSEGSTWTSGSVINEDTEITAVWEEAPIYNKKYWIEMFTGTSTNGASETADDRSAIFDIDPDGYCSDCKSYPLYGYSVQISDYDEVTHKAIMTATKGTTTEIHQIYIEPTYGYIIVNATAGASAEWTKVWFLTYDGTSSSNVSSNFTSSYWNSGKDRVIAYTYGEKSVTVYIHNNQVYFGVTFTTVGGEAVAANAVYNSSTVVIKDSNGSKIVELGYNGTTLVELDGHQGTYISTRGSVTLDGIGGFTWEGKSGTYTASDSSYPFELTLKVVENGKEVGWYTCDVTGEDSLRDAPQLITTSITLYCDGFADDVSEFIIPAYVDYTIPEPTNIQSGMVFECWMDEDENYVTTINLTPDDAGSYAYTGLFNYEVTITYVTGNGFDNTVVSVGAYHVAEAPATPYTNGQIFKGWYTTSTFEAGTEYDPTQTVSADKTVYGKWEVGSPAHVDTESNRYFEYSEETGTWTTTNQGVGSSTAYLVYVADADCTITFSYKVSSESGWDFASLLVIPTEGSTVYTFGSSRSNGKSGVVDWTTVTITLKAGETMKFGYTKDNSGNKNEDTAWVKDIVIA